MSRPLPRQLVAAALTLGLALLGACSADEADAPARQGDGSSSAADSAEPSSSSAPLDESLGGAGSRDGDLPDLPDAEQGALLGQFVNFALRPDPQSSRSVSFADSVDIGIGTQVRRSLRGSDLGNPRRWRIPVDGAIEGVQGRVSALESITTQAERAVEAQQTEGIFVTTSGMHDRCAADPTPPLDGYSVEDQLAVMPGARSIDSCGQWFAVDLYTDDAGDIAAVRLDLFEP